MVYFLIANILFLLYLCRFEIIRSISVTFYYFWGKHCVFDHNFKEAEEKLSWAFDNCHPDAKGNIFDICSFIVINQHNFTNHLSLLISTILPTTVQRVFNHAILCQQNVRIHFQLFPFFFFCAENQRRILSYLVPVRLRYGILPKPELLKQYAQLLIFAFFHERVNDLLISLRINI